MKRKLSQSQTRAARQIRNHGEVSLAIKNFPGREVWSGTVADLHAAPITCGIPEPLLMHPGSHNAAVVAQDAIRRAK